MQANEILECSPLAQFAIGLDHRITHWNHACELLTGFAADRMIGTDNQWQPFYAQKRPILADLVLADDLRSILTHYETKDVVKSKVIPRAWEATDFFESIGGKPRFISFLAAPIISSKGTVKGAVISLRDVTDQKNYEQALMQSREGYRILAENIADGVVLIQNGTFLMVNHAFANLMGFSNPNKLAGVPAVSVIAEEYKDQFVDTFEKMEAGSVHYKVLQWPIARSDGSGIWVEGRPRVIQWENRPAVLSTVIDVTETRADKMAMEKEARRLKIENQQLKSNIRDRYRFGNIIGKSQRMQEVYEMILKAAATDASSIVYGESGTGKELVARAIHDMSDRRRKPFITVNCGAIPENLLESEFFGHQKGAFTGAHRDKLGFLAMADGGTLFMDEIGELNLNIQVKLLRAIDGGGYTPVGGTKIYNPDVRIIAATHRNLVKWVQAGLMRDDFLYRIHVVPIELPPLRYRKEDIPLLIDHFLRKEGARQKLSDLPAKILQALYDYNWPGNVRELQNALRRFLAVGRLDFLYADDCDSDSDVSSEGNGAGMPAEKSMNLGEALARLERQMITQTLTHTNWNRTRAAVLMGLPRKTLFRKMKKYEIN